MSQGVFEFFAAKGTPQSPLGLQIMVHGLVPQGQRHASAAVHFAMREACGPLRNAACIASSFGARVTVMIRVRVRVRFGLMLGSV